MSPITDETGNNEDESMSIFNQDSHELPNGEYRYYTVVGDIENEADMRPFSINGEYIEWEDFLSSYDAAVSTLRQSGYDPDKCMVYDCQDEVYVSLHSFFFEESKSSNQSCSDVK